MMIRKLVTARIALILGLSLTALACTDEGEGQGGSGEAEDTDGTGGDGDGDGDAGSEAGDGDSGDGDGDSGDGDGDSGNGDGDSGDGDGDSGDGDGDGDGELELIEQACADACALVAECFFPVPDCTVLCVESHLGSGDCLATELAFTACINTLTCAEYEALMSGEAGSECEAELAASETCGGE